MLTVPRRNGGITRLNALRGGSVTLHTTSSAAAEPRPGRQRRLMVSTKPMMNLARSARIEHVEREVERLAAQIENTTVGVPR